MNSLLQLTEILMPKLGPLGTALGPEWLFVLLTLLAAVVLIACFLAPIAGFSTYVERRVADGIKLILKEDTIPAGADRALFKMAPYFCIVGAFMSFVTIPFGRHLVVADLDVGLLYLLAVSSLVVVGILMAGWASNNKWSLLGAMRSAAQIVSYEIPVALALMVPVLMVGSLSLQELNLVQGQGFRSWLIWSAFPAAFIAMFVYFIAALAEVNRTPFDLPEAESELVAGFATEYSGIRWGLFFVAEYTNMFLVSAVTATAFLGGWTPSKANVPFGAIVLFFVLIFAIKSLWYVGGILPDVLKGRSIYGLLSSRRPRRISKPLFAVLAALSVAGATGLHFVAGGHWLVALFFFIAKVYSLVLVIIWIRWTLPRIRIDQMMGLCWKKLVPIAFACICWAALVQVVL
jgi:NADH-quinone oxidoreductase subunit H